MRSINRFTIHGNVGSITPFEKSTKVNIATNRAWANEAGERKEVTDWVQLTILDEKQANWIAENVKVGDVAVAEGRISNGSYERDGATVYTTDLIVSTFNTFAKP